MRIRARRTPPALAAAVTALLLLCPHAQAQRWRGRGPDPRVCNMSLTPHWFGDGTCFWYERDLPEGKREFILVDARTGTREAAFDHRRLAAALQKAGLENVRADRLPIEALEFDLPAAAVTFRAGDGDWRCNLETYELAKVEHRDSTPAGGFFRSCF